MEDRDDFHGRWMNAIDDAIGCLEQFSQIWPTHLWHQVIRGGKVLRLPKPSDEPLSDLLRVDR